MRLTHHELGQVISRSSGLQNGRLDVFMVKLGKLRHAGSNWRRGPRSNRDKIVIVSRPIMSGGLPQILI